MGDGGKWLRRQCLVMAQNTYTPVQFWLKMPLIEFMGWITASNELLEEKEKKKKG